MQLNGSKRNCANCGAPVTTEICPYCHVPTGLDTRNAYMEYPVIECKEANFDFPTFIFVSLFAIPGIIIPLSIFGFLSMFSEEGGTEVGIMLLPFIFIPILFGVMGIFFLVRAIKPLIIKSQVKKYGNDIEAIVYGYMNDNTYFNGMPTQIVKLLVNTNEGKRFILYQLGDSTKPFKINSKINLKVYKDMFLIENKKKYYF